MTQERDAVMLMNQECWPHQHFLPLKRRGQNPLEDGNLGIVLWRDRTVVILCNMMDVIYADAARFESFTRERFPTTRALLKVWEVD